MRITEETRIFWRQLTGWQQIKIAGLIVLIFGLMLLGWVDSCSSMREVRRLEREAAKAGQAAAEHRERADRLARETAKIAAELKRLEELRNEAAKQLDEAHHNTRDARALYERTLRERRPDAPDTAALCRELAALGYPCE